MKNFTKFKKLIIATIVGLLVFQNVSPVLATISDEKAGEATLKVVKEDKETKAKINGSTFEVKDKQTGETKNLSISENGTGVLTSLNEGEYTVKEKTAAEGYTLDEEVYSVTLTNKEEEVTSVSTKEKQETKVTGEDTTKDSTSKDTTTKDSNTTKQPVKGNNLKAAITENIFLKATLKDGTGKEFTEDQRVKNGAAAIMELNFGFHGKNYKAGDTFTTVLPDEFNFGTQDISGNFLPSTEASWTLNVKTRELTITILKDGVQEGDYNVGINTALKTFKNTDVTDRSIVFKTAGADTVYNIDIIPVITDATTVSVTPSPSNINPDKATVDALFNLTKENNAKGDLRLSDSATNGSSTIDRDTIKVYSSDVSAGGIFIGTKKLLVEGTDYTLTYTATGITVSLIGGLAGKGYEVTYDRNINKPSPKLTSLGTSAYTIGDDVTLSSNSANVDVRMNNYKHIEKNGSYLAGSQTINWVINFNYDQSELTPSTVLTDIVNDNGISYVPNSFKINEVTFNQTTLQPIVGKDASADWNTSANAANGDFNTTYKGTSNKAYQITYSTKVTDFKSRTIKNEITDQKGEAAIASLNIQPNVIKKSGGTIDYLNNKMTWTIAANSDRLTMRDITITDEFSTGVKSLESYTVEAFTDNVNSVVLQEGKDYTIERTDSPRGFVIKLIGDYATTDKRILVSMVTNIDLNDVTSTLDNKAIITYYDDDVYYSDTSGANVTPDPSIMNNGAKFGTFNQTTGNIDWIVSLNAKSTNSQKLIFDDDMPTGVSYVEGSLQYRNVASSNEMTSLSIPLSSTGVLAKPGDSNYPTAIDASAKKIHLEFANLGTGKVFVKYSTKPDNSWYFTQYVNNAAKVSDNGANERTYSYSAYSTLLNRALTKTGVIDTTYANKINWTTELTSISPDRPVSNPLITDTMEIGTTGAQLVKSSFRVTNSTTGDTIDPQYYDITFDGNNFNVQFKNYTATAPIKVEYSTISLLSGAVSNTATVSSSDYGALALTYRYKTTIISPTFTMGSGTGIATIGSLEITKVDKDDSSKKLAGAKFQLYTLDGDIAGPETTTNSEGKAIFDGIQSGSYKLVETEAPAGYKLSDEYKNGKEIVVGVDSSVTSLTIQNAAKTGNVVLTKEDSKTKTTLAGAEFELQTSTGTKVQDKLVSDVNGQIEVSDLAPGDYKFIETKAPTGYELDATPATFTIGFNQTTPVTITKGNTEKTGSVVLTKEDSKTKAALAGAEFELQTSAGTKVQDKLVTGTDGKLEVKDLTPGDYQLIETAAPTGYQLDATPVTFTITFNQTAAVNVTKDNTAKSGSVILTKEDSATKAALSGAEFELQTSTGTKVAENLVSDTDGKIEVKDLTPGDYKFIETKAPTGYQLDATPLAFTITNNQSEALKVTKDNTAKAGSVTLTKEDSATKAKLAGAEFELQNSSGTKLQENLVTDANGELEVSDLAPGDYKFVETKAPTGYQLDATAVAFTIEFNQSGATNVVKDNTAKTGSVVLTKEDSATKAKLAGAEFELQTATGTKVADKLVTDADGKLEVKDLAPGDYQFVETKAPTGYELDATPVTFTVAFNQAVAATVTKDNTQKTGSVILTKEDSVTKAALSGAEFELQNASGTKLDDKLVSDASGKLELKDLAPGNYQLVETAAPAGYKLDATPVAFTIEFNQAEAVKVTKENVAKAGSVVLTKQDSASKAGLAGAEFELQNASGTKVSDKLVTDANGKIEINDLAPGDYQFVETKAPVGYELDATPVTFTIAFNQSGATSVVKENTAKTGSVVLTKEASTTKAALAGAEFELQTSIGTKITSNLVTDADGKLVVTDLAPGTYQFVETKAPTGYQVDSTPLTFTIVLNQTAALQISKENTAKTGSVVLAKEDSKTKAALAGAEFELQNGSGTKVQEKLVTAANGKLVINDLAPGDYQLVETKAPTGYDLNATPVPFTITFNQATAVNVTKENTQTTGSVVLTKEDSVSKAALSGAEFELQTATGTKLQDKLVTNTSGKLEVKDLAPGDYQLVETKAPTGYDLNATPVPFTITFNQATAVNVTKENTAKAGGAILTKEDSVTKAGLAGAEFELQTSTGTKVQDKLVTDASGKLVVNDLLPGDYQFVETKAPTGYQMDATPVKFTIVFNQSGATNVTKDNVAKTGSVTLTKEDSVTKDALAGAEFELQTSTGTKVGGTLVTDADGKVTVNDLAPGDYQFVETKAPTGYQLDAAPKAFTIAFNQSEALKVTIDNVAKTGSVSLTKEDSVTKAGLSGAEFEVQNASGTKVKDNLVTDADGKLIVNDLAPGDYQFVETKAPTGYQLDAAPVKFTVAFNQSGAVQVTKANVAKTGSVTLTKEDSATKAGLSGAEFEVQNASGTKVKDNLVTDADGKVTVKDLAPGDYKFVETKAPTGYQLDGTPKAFTITFNQTETLNVTKENVAKTGSVTLTKEDSVTKAALSGAEFEVQNAVGTKVEGNLVTNADGKVTVKDLAPGDYQFVETKAPKGYDLDAKPVKFTIAFNQDEPLQVSKTNTMSTGSVVLTKLDGQSKAPLANATFKLVDKNNKVMKSVTTDKNGKIEITNLVPGDYQLIETKAPAGYELDTVPVKVKIDFAQLSAQQVTKTNTKTIVSGTVTAEFVDTKGNKLSDKEIYTGVVGDKYATKAKEIAGYKLTKTPANQAGVYKDSPQTVTYVYEKVSDPIVINPTNPTKPSKSQNTGNKSTTTKEVKKLPSTGDEFPYDMLFTGLFVSTLGLFLLRKTKVESK
ncbi:SpaA isopeptide-forming pilin-related protein [Listeria welshimeri]|uniref:SpaA isopeptide-forming pilin-related protein n=1 Tax=Listeria welshimeri TaxID=1643 RepID=UPI002B258EE0|nr:SpaA isopeptide-forming pilin-related protein [Listeria welshimeri]